MAPSLSAIERRNPPSRQKACAACTRAKRRCDFATPACLRCSMRSLSCEYPTRHTKTNRARQEEESVAASSIVQSPKAGVSPDEPGPDFFDINTNLLLSADPGLSWLETDSTHAHFAQCINPILINFTDPCTRYFPDGLKIRHPLSTAQPLEQSWSLAPPTTMDQVIADVIASHLQYAIDIFMEVPRYMVENLHSPWIHRNLYRDRVPRSIRDAQAACALYLAKNEVNAPVIMRSIESFCADLLSSPSPVSGFDALAYAHALLLYQIIRLFDGDIASRASADKCLPALENAALSLLSHVHFEDPLFPAPDLPLDPIGPTKLFWQSWLFQESVRRTMLFIFFFLQTYRMVSAGMRVVCDGKIGLVHSWTFSAHLWQANTPVEFAKAWNGRNHFVITNSGFRKVLEEAKPDDVDSFGRILLSAMMGQDEADGWFAARGGSLRDERCF